MTIYTVTMIQHFIFKLKKGKKNLSFPQVHIHNMIFAHIFLPAILFAICKSQPYHHAEQQQSFRPNNERPSMDEYRHLVINSVAQMKDSCRVYDYLLDVDKKWTEDDGKLEGGTTIKGKTFRIFNGNSSSSSST